MLQNIVFISCDPACILDATNHIMQGDSRSSVDGTAVVFLLVIPGRPFVSGFHFTGAFELLVCRIHVYLLNWIAQCLLIPFGRYYRKTATLAILSPQNQSLDLALLDCAQLRCLCRHQIMILDHVRDILDPYHQETFDIAKSLRCYEQLRRRISRRIQEVMNSADLQECFQLCVHVFKFIYSRMTSCGADYFRVEIVLVSGTRT